MTSRQPHTRRHPIATRRYTTSYRPTAQPRLELSPPATRRLPVKLKVAALVLILLFLSGHTVWTQHVSAQTAAAKRIELQQAADRAHKQAVLTQQLQGIVASHPELNLSLAVASDTGASQHFGSNDYFDAASTGKLITAADFLHHVERGTASLQMTLDGQSAQQWLKIMIINSDDTAWSELNTYLGHHDLEAYAATIGINDYQAATNSLTASDITSLLHHLYGRNLLNNADRSLLLSYLAQANYRDFAVAGVPPGYTVYHKIGIDNDSVHDALIVTHGGHSVELTIFTDGRNTYNWDARKQLMQTITAEVVHAYL